MSDPIAVLIADLVDDAGLFPPARLGMADALDRYRRNAATADPVLSHRFVCPADRLPELQNLLSAGDRVRLSVIVEPRPAEIASALRSLTDEDRLRLEAVEFGWPGDGPAAASRALSALPAGLPVFVELPTAGPDLRDHALAELAGLGLAVKVRCGGVRADLFPSAPQLAGLIAAVVRRGVAFKATAGLHHAVGYRDPATGFEHYGFLNLLLAVHRAATGQEPEAVAVLLQSRDEARLVAEARSLTDTEARAVRRSFISYGSCSTEEPIADLERLGLHPGVVGQPRGSGHKVH